MRDQVTDLLRQEILTGKIEEDEAVREIPLAKRFNVSRGPIRDAILQLTQEGLLRSQPNRGARVGPLWGPEIRPIMVGMRFEVESFAMGKLMQSETEIDFGGLRKNLRHFELACRDEDLGMVVQMDIEFHRLILRLSDVPGLEAVWLPLMGGMRLPYSRHRKLLESHKEHAAILKAMESGQARRALAALKRNIR